MMILNYNSHLTIKDCEYIKQSLPDEHARIKVYGKYKYDEKYKKILISKIIKN